MDEEWPISEIEHFQIYTASTTHGDYQFCTYFEPKKHKVKHILTMLATTQFKPLKNNP